MRQSGLIVAAAALVVLWAAAVLLFKTPGLLIHFLLFFAVIFALGYIVRGRSARTGKPVDR